MISGALFVIGLFACFQNGESQITWTTPVSTTDTATGSFTAVDEQGGSSTVKSLSQTVTAAATGTDAIATYSILVNSFDIFAMSGTTVGTLNLAANMALDYEFAPNHVIVIGAVDDNGTPNSGTVTMSLSVNDVTTDDPMWNVRSFCAVLPDGTTAGTSVSTTVSLPGATGYNIYPTGVFTISSTGVIQSSITLNRAVAHTYDMAVNGYVTSGGLSSSAIVYICIDSEYADCPACPGSATAIKVNIMAILSLLLLLIVKN